jgi:hypothetical protein
LHLRRIQSWRDEAPAILALAMSFDSSSDRAFEADRADEQLAAAVGDALDEVGGYGVVDAEVTARIDGGKAPLETEPVLPPVEPLGSMS